MNFKQWVAIFILTMSTSAQATDFIMAKVYVDNVVNPKTILDVAKDCQNSDVCKGAIIAAEKALGVPVSKVVAGAASLAAPPSQNSSYINVSFPKGFAYCKASMVMVSIVPHDGPEGSTFLGRADSNGLYYETWSPTPAPGNGRSWVEAAITVLGVDEASAPRKYADGSCHRPNGRILWYCRGGGCISTEDTGQAKDASTRPGANSRK